MLFTSVGTIDLHFGGRIIPRDAVRIYDDESGDHDHDHHHQQQQHQRLCGPDSATFDEGDDRHETDHMMMMNAVMIAAS